MNADKLENFERAFRMGTAGCRRTCNCGKEYFDNANGGYSWEEGELERLLASKTAVALGYAPGDMMFEGREYVDACDCWHKRAEQIMGFLDGHAQKIAEYLTLEKKRKQAIADHAPEVG
jgi:hypothetical protein